MHPGSLGIALVQETIFPLGYCVRGRASSGSRKSFLGPACAACQVGGLGGGLPGRAGRGMLLTRKNEHLSSL